MYPPVTSWLGAAGIPPIVITSAGLFTHTEYSHVLPLVPLRNLCRYAADVLASHPGSGLCLPVHRRLRAGLHPECYLSAVLRSIYHVHQSLCPDPRDDRQVLAAR